MHVRAFTCRAAAWLLLGAGMIFGQASHAWAQFAGVAIDAEGVVQRRTYHDEGGQLTRQLAAAAKAALGQQLAARSDLRYVSLRQLEAEIVQRQGAVTDAMRYLGGIRRLKYVFCFPEQKDIVLAGPAEGWMSDVSGRVVGISSGRPVLQLQDLLVALRSFPAGKPGPSVVGCSIDPTQEGLAAMQAFLKQVGTTLSSPNDSQFIVNGLRNSLGLQKVTVLGVSPKTNLARILVEADYRMKLIGIGLEQPPVHLSSFVQRVSPSQVARNALFRWFFVPEYQCLRVSDDGLAMELVGDGVKLVGEDEMVAENGQRHNASKGSKASQEFVSSFTKRYPELADRSPVYAELRNVIDLLVASAWIQHQDLYGRTGWNMPVLGSERSIPVETMNPPKMVESAVTAVWKGSRLMTPIGGGVNIQPAVALTPANRLPDTNGAVAKAREEVKPSTTPSRWWWE